jgi:excisionase family DNA binding protein
MIVEEIPTSRRKRETLGTPASFRQAVVNISLTKVWHQHGCIYGVCSIQSLQGEISHMAQSSKASAFGGPSREQREEVETYQKVRALEVKLMGPDGRAQALPNNLYSFLLQLLADLRAGQAVTLLQSRHEFTTIEASKVLGMSRQFLVRLLERGELPFHKVGTHRRIYARDALAYKAKRDLSRRKNLDDLARAEYAEGLYGQIPDDFNAEQ